MEAAILSPLAFPDGDGIWIPLSEKDPFYKLAARQPVNDLRSKSGEILPDASSPPPDSGEPPAKTIRCCQQTP